MVFVLLLGLIFAAMVRPTRLTASLAYSAALIAIVAMTIVALLGRKAARPFAAGFAIAGWASMVVHFGISLAPPDRKSTFEERPTPTLPTIAFLDALYSRILSESYQPAPSPAKPTPLNPGGPTGSLTFGPTLVSISSGTVSITVPPTPTERPAAFWLSLDRGTAGTTYFPERSPSFLTAGIAFFTIVLAWMAGIFADWVRSRAVADESRTPVS